MGNRGPKPIYTPEEREARDREQKADYRRNKSNVGRDISIPPNDIDWNRREACKYDLKLYLETYHAKDFGLSWSPDHLILIDAMQRAILEYLQQLIAYPRGSGKTSIMRRSVQWGTNYGHVVYSLLFGAESQKAKQHIDDIKRDYLQNDLLFQDFPELCHPIRESEGIGNRALYQTLRSVPTGLRWGETVIMPTIDESVERGNAGRVIGVGTITGSAARGPLVNGHRPDFALIDDPQTRRSAKSPGQIQERLDTINGDILGMAGPDKSISAVCTATVIYKGDLADKLLDHEENPEWNGVRVSMLKSFPSDMRLWESWNDIRKACLIDDRSLEPAHTFYKERRAEMDVGAVVYWDDRITPGFVSALESAMALYFRDPVAFASEYQNEPVDLYDSESAMPTIDELNKKRHKYPRGVAPPAATTLVSMIDVQGKLLYWYVMAFERNFTGYVLDYGTWPDQGREYFTLRDARNTFFRSTPGKTFHGALYIALNQCMDYLESKAWKTGDGNDLDINVGLVDGQFGDSTGTVYKVIQERGKFTPWMPSHGQGHSAKKRPFSDSLDPADLQSGPNWRIPNPMKTKRRQKHVVYETNFWKTFHAQHWSVALGDTGSFSFYEKQGRHQMPAEHFHGERCLEVEANGRRVVEWLELPTAPDNHFLDLGVGCCVAASIAGCSENALEEGRGRSKRTKLTRESLSKKVAYV